MKNISLDSQPIKLRAGTKYIIIVYDSIEPGQIDVLSTDTGLLVFINEKIFNEIVSIFDYDKLLNSQNELLDIQYWESIASSYEPYDLALICAPGVGSDSSSRAAAHIE